jgi:hypothetical protein
MYGSASVWRQERTDRSFRRSITPVSESDLRFTTGARPDYRLSVRLQNNEDVPISISSIEASCGCTTITPASLTLPARGQATVCFELDLTGVRGGSAVPVPFETSVYLREKLHSKSKVERFKIIGKIFQPFSFSREPVEIYGTPPEASARARFTLDSSIRLKDVAVKSASEEWDVVLAAEGITGGPITIELTPKSARPPGLFQVPFSVHARRDDGSATPSVVLLAPINVITRVRALPCPVDLGPLDLGVESRFSIHLAARDGSSFAVRTVSQPYNITMNVEQRPSAKAANITGTIVVAREGYQELPVKIDITYPGRIPGESLTVPVRYFGRGRSDTSLAGISE